VFKVSAKKKSPSNDSRQLLGTRLQLPRKLYVVVQATSLDHVAA